jgi:CelD/BcsL family acetyltransferase involved in cellulose biosynthesis
VRHAAIGAPQPQSGGGEIRIEIISDLAGFEALRNHWQALAERTATGSQLFQHVSFVAHWARHYLSPEMRLFIVTARRDGKLMLVLPLVRQKRFGIDMLRFMGAPVAQFSDLIEDAGVDDALRARIWDAVAASGADVLEVKKVRDDASFMKLGRSDGILFEEQSAPFVDLSRRVEGDQPGPAYSAKMRSSHRRRIRRLTEQGELRIVSVASGAAAAELAAAAIAMKRDSLAHAGIVSPTVADPRFAAFFKSIAADQDCETPLRVTTLSLNGAPLGIDLSFDGKQRSFGHVLATNAQSDALGAGQVLIHAVFAAALARGSSLFELNAPADAYKMQHADGAVAVRSFAFPFTRKGALYARLVLKRGLPGAKKLLRLLPTGAARGVIARLAGSGR